MGKITLTTIAEELVSRNGVSKEVADNFVRAIVETIEKGLREDGLVKVKGLGTFKLMEMSDRGSVDINTGERITIKGYRKVSFTPDSAMKEFVNRPFAHFEPTELNEGYPAEEEQQEAAVDEGVANETTDAIEPLEAPLSSDIQPDKVESKELESPEEDTAASNETIVVEADEVPEVEDEAAVVPEEVPSPMVDEAPVEVEESESPVEMHESEAVVAEEEPVEIEEEIAEIKEETAEIEEVAAETEEETVEAEEETVETQEETVETEETAADEEQVEAVVEEAEESEESIDIEEGAESETPVSEEIKPKRQSSRRGGCGWLIVVLLIALACGVYYLITIDQDTLSDYEAKMEEYNDMMVNPNLEEELGEGWGEEPQVAPAPKEAPDTVNPEKEQTVVAAEPATPKVKSEPQKEVAPAPQASADAKFCAVTPTESLEAKAIKDITPADTTDYIIDGTLVTHELQNGETIIQLARKYYGDKRLWPYIVKYNWMKDYNNVAVGQMINIPVLKDMK